MTATSPPCGPCATRACTSFSAFGPQAAAIAARYGDALWTLGDPESAPAIIEAYREACTEQGREPGEVILQSGFALADDEDAAIAAARK